MNTWEDFDREARTVDNVTKEQAPDCVQLLQDAVGLFGDAFSIADNSNTTDATLAKMCLLTQNFATLKCAVDLALRGYYSQSMNLLRSVYENLIAILYLTKCPNKAPFWLRAKKNKQPPSHSAMLKKIGKDFNPLKGKMRKWYGTLCRFAHTDPVGVLPQISTNFVPDETSINYGTTYKDDLFKASAYTISLWTAVMLAEISQWIPNTKEWHNKRSLLEEKVLKFINEENKRFESESK